MTDIIDFLQYKSVRDEQLIERYFKTANSLNERLDTLIQQNTLQLNDHKLFLAFLAYLELQQLEPRQIFKDVVTMPKHLFEAKYEMVWSQVVKLAVTFLTILRTNDYESYAQFSR